MALHNSGIGVWIHNHSRYALVIMYPSTNLPRCVMPFRSQAHAFSLYDWHVISQDLIIEVIYADIIIMIDMLFPRIWLLRWYTQTSLSWLTCYFPGSDYWGDIRRHHYHDWHVISQDLIFEVIYADIIIMIDMLFPRIWLLRWYTQTSLWRLTCYFPGSDHWGDIRRHHYHDWHVISQDLIIEVIYADIIIMIDMLFPRIWLLRWYTQTSLSWLTCYFPGSDHWGDIRIHHYHDWHVISQDLIIEVIYADIIIMINMLLSRIWLLRWYTQTSLSWLTCYFPGFDYGGDIRRHHYDDWHVISQDLIIEVIYADIIIMIDMLLSRIWLLRWFTQTSFMGSLISKNSS